MFRRLSLGVFAWAIVPLVYDFHSVHIITPWRLALLIYFVIVSTQVWGRKPDVLSELAQVMITPVVIRFLFDDANTSHFLPWLGALVVGTLTGVCSIALWDRTEVSRVRVRRSPRPLERATR